MRLVDIFEDVNDEQQIIDIIVMFQLVNGEQVLLDVVLRELQNININIHKEALVELLTSKGFIIKDNSIFFSNPSDELGGGVSLEYDEAEISTPAESKAKEATRKAMRKK